MRKVRTQPRGGAYPIGMGKPIAHTAVVNRTGVGHGQDRCPRIAAPPSEPVARRPGAPCRTSGGAGRVDRGPSARQRVQRGSAARRRRDPRSTTGHAGAVPRQAPAGPACAGADLGAGGRRPSWPQQRPVGAAAADAARLLRRGSRRTRLGRVRDAGRRCLHADCPAASGPRGQCATGGGVGRDSRRGVAAGAGMGNPCQRQAGAAAIERDRRARRAGRPQSSGARRYRHRAGGTAPLPGIGQPDDGPAVRADQYGAQLHRERRA